MLIKIKFVGTSISEKLTLNNITIIISIDFIRYYK